MSDDQLLIWMLVALIVGNLVGFGLIWWRKKRQTPPKDPNS